MIVCMCCVAFFNSWHWWKAANEERGSCVNIPCIHKDLQGFSDVCWR